MKNIAKNAFDFVTDLDYVLPAVLIAGIAYMVLLPATDAFQDSFDFTRVVDFYTSDVSYQDLKPR